MPVIFDGPKDGESAFYSMPTPDWGYKIGFDDIVRGFLPDDADRTPDEAQVALAMARLRRDLPGITGDLLDVQGCCWTDSPDGRFVIDRLHGGRVVLACGDSGEGFKFSALMGRLLADMIDGRDVDPDVATFSLARFAPSTVPQWPHVVGR